MKDITTYCEKTIESTNENIRNTETTLRNLTENQELLNKMVKRNAKATNLSCKSGNSKSSTI